MRISILLTLVLATASTVLGQPGMMNPMQGVGFGQQQLGLGQQQVSFVPMPQQQQQRPLNYPIVGQQQLGNIGGFNYPIQQQQPIYPTVGNVGLGNIGQVGQVGQVNPLWNNIAAGWSNLGQQQLLGNVGATTTTGIPLNYGATTGTIPAVLPQNYGNPSASFGSLAQPVLSPQQIQQIVPTAQLQAALDQRVHGFGQVQQGQPIAFGNQVGLGGLGLGMGGLQQQPFIGA